MPAVKAFSIEEELGVDPWEQPPPGEEVDFQSGFFEVSLASQLACFCMVYRVCADESC
jgi:hypothetical protein